MQLPAFFFDIDGTLLDYPHQINQITPKTKAALDKLRQNHPIFIASGRTKCFIDPAILDYPFDGFVTCNGAYIEYHNQCIYKQPMSQQAMQQALAIAKQYDAVVYLESRDAMYTYHANSPLHNTFAKKWAMNPKTIIIDFDPTKIEVYIGMIIAKNEADCEPIKKALSPYFDVSQHVNQISFDLTLKQTNKATGLKQVMNYFDATLQEAWAFGDGNNDIEMIEAVGHGIAMGNAVPELKKVAFDVTTDAKEDGIVTCLEKYHWI